MLAWCRVAGGHSTEDFVMTAKIINVLQRDYFHIGGIIEYWLLSLHCCRCGSIIKSYTTVYDVEEGRWMLTRFGWQRKPFKSFEESLDDLWEVKMGSWYKDDIQRLQSIENDYEDINKWSDAYFLG